MDRGIGGAMLSSLQVTEDNLDDLSDMVGPELANLMNAPAAIAVKVTHATTITSTSSCSSSTASSSSSSGGLSDMPADISDLRSSDLLQSLPGMIDIDRIFADFQAEQQQQVKKT
jgi:hypothetical protein